MGLSSFWFNKVTITDMSCVHAEVDSRLASMKTVTLKKVIARTVPSLTSREFVC